MITSVDDVLPVARCLAEDIAVGASERDAQRVLPHTEIKALKDSGLLAITVPKQCGGIAAPAPVVAEVFRLLAHADPSLAQIPHSHFTFLEALRLQGTVAQHEQFFGAVLGGALVANAQSERGPHPIDVDSTTLTPRAGGDYVLTGRKFYSTGALFADWVVVRASRSDGSGEVPVASTPKAVAFVPRDAPGLEVVDDWDGMGQRTSCRSARSSPGRPPTGREHSCGTAPSTSASPPAHSRPGFIRPAVPERISRRAYRRPSRIRR